MDHLPKIAGANTLVKAEFLQVPYIIPTNDKRLPPKRPWMWPLGVDGFLLVLETSLEELRDEKKKRQQATNPSFFQSFLAKPITWTQRRQSGFDLDLLVFAQYALYFGLMTEAFAVADVHVDPLRFIREDSRGQPVVSSEALNEYLCYWHLVIDGKPPSTKARHLDQLLRLFSGAAEWLAKASPTLRTFDSPPNAQEGYATRFYNPHGAGYPRAQVVLLSIRVLIETLSKACRTVYSEVTEVEEGNPKMEIPDHAMAHFVLHSDYEFVERLMLDAGWCPNEIAILEHRSSSNQNSLRVFLANVNRRRLGRDHSRCTRHRCYRLLEYPYYPKHTKENCHCPNVYSTRDDDGNVGDIVGIIRGGRVPLIRMKRGGSDDDLIEILSHEPRSKSLTGEERQAETSSQASYIAVSHVWSDGMGNRAGNYLPACQIRHLQEAVKYAQAGVSDMDDDAIDRLENVPFWIDTLCIPRFHHEEKKVAIRMMAETYRNAESVLVLDKGLQRTDFDPDPAHLTDGLMAIAQSTWARRLWTLQEGRMATLLHFQFANAVFSSPSREGLFASSLKIIAANFGVGLGLVPIATEVVQQGLNCGAASKLLRALVAGGYSNAVALWEASGNSPVNVGDHPELRRFFQRMSVHWTTSDAFNYAISRVAGFLPSSDPEVSLPLRLLDVCNELQRRRTTEAADEAITLATLVGADLRMVLDTEGTRRMETLLRSLQSVPSRIVFFQGERYPDDGSRWIPTSFLLKNGRLGDIWGHMKAPDTLLEEAQPSLEGLRVRLPGLRLLSAPASTAGERCYLSHGSSKYVMTLTEGNRLRLAGTDWARYANTDLSVILATPLRDTSLPAWSGVLVSHRRDEEGVSYVRFEYTVYIHRAETRLKTSFASIAIDWPGTKANDRYSSIEILSDSHLWCIG